MNKIKILYICLILGNILQAQTVIKSSVIGCGASQMEGSNFKLKGTIGQPVIHTTQTTTIINAQGFWTGYQQRIVKVNDSLTEHQIKMDLFPNPVVQAGTLKLEINRNQEFRIAIINDLGVKTVMYELYHAIEGKSSIHLPLENLHNGVYFLHVYNHEFAKVIPFLKTNY